MTTAARKNVKLLLVENVDDLGIVGDVVNVRTGYARNFLLPRGLATQPDEALIAQLASKRKAAEATLAAQRKDREALTKKLDGVEVELVRACNDMGILYGAVTQQEIAAALNKLGHKVVPRDVRLTAAIKRIENVDVHVKLDRDLDAMIKVKVRPDRELSKEESTGEEAAAAGPASSSEGGKRDALGRALDDALKGVGKTGWGGGGEGKSDSGKSDSGKAEKKGKGEKAKK